MLTIGIKFPAGRYHATPWGRNVNEGVVEWPPSPYRLARALIDAWKRRKPDWSVERVFPILEALSKPVQFSLPAATAAHTRSFLSSNLPDSTAKQLIFDAFVAVDPEQPVFIGINHDLSESSVDDLRELLSELNYMGRSESWIQAQVVKNETSIEWNSFPKTENSSRRDEEIVQVASVLSLSEYPVSKLSDKATAWLDGLCMTTAGLLKSGWSNPPALKWVDYVRSIDAFKVTPKLRVGERIPLIRCATYSLASAVLPSIKDTLPIAERIRAKIMGIHKRVMNDDPSSISRLFSGKDQKGDPLKGHKHVFYQPLDNDGDGRLDHLTITSPEPFSRSELVTLDRLKSIWQSDGRPDVNLALFSLKADLRTLVSKKWISVTPFVTKRHYRKGRGKFDDWLMSEVRKECSFLDLPAPKSIEFIPHTYLQVCKLRWAEFVRSRKNAAPLRGYGCILEFEQPVAGPFAIGAGCHFGLGCFKPYE